MPFYKIAPACFSKPMISIHDQLAGEQYFFGIPHEVPAFI